MLFNQTIGWVLGQGRGRGAHGDACELEALSTCVADVCFCPIFVVFVVTSAFFFKYCGYCDQMLLIRPMHFLHAVHSTPIVAPQRLTRLWQQSTWHLHAPTKERDCYVIQSSSSVYSDWHTKQVKIICVIITHYMCDTQCTITIYHWRLLDHWRPMISVS